MFNKQRPVIDIGQGKSMPLSEEHYEPAATYLARERRMIWLRGPILGAPQRFDMYSPSIAHDSLLAFNWDSPEKPIYLMIDSPGGAISDGFILFDAIKMSRAPVITVCQQAASMATILFIAGAERLVYPNARLMMHLPQGGAHGDVKEVELQAAEMKKLSTTLADMYIALPAVKKTRRQLLKDIDREYWMGAQEAIDYGLADRIITQEELYGTGPGAGV